MIAGVLLLLIGQGPVPTPAIRCLPDADGYLSMRLRGSIEADIQWREPLLECTGMARPDGRGLRLRFAGPVEGRGELAIVIAAPELGMGASGRSVPVNITLLDSAGERIYGTQGDNRCLLDEVEQQAIANSALPPHSFRVVARGFCTAPARAVDGDGAVLLTRFDFAGFISFAGESGPPRASSPPATDPEPLLAGLPQSDVEVVTEAGTHRFRAWIAADDASRVRGLMRVPELPADRGMLFLFDRPQYAVFWMKDTRVSLDILFVASNGRVVNIARETVPFSLAPIESIAPVTGVLEITAGSAARLGIAPGDLVRHPAFGKGR